MHGHHSVYRGYAISISGMDSAWTFSAEPIDPGLPILPHSADGGHNSQDAALIEAQRQIDRLFDMEK